VQPEHRLRVRPGEKVPVDGHQVALGSNGLLADLNVAVDELAGQAEHLRRQGQTVMFVAVDGRLAGLLGVADPIKQSTPEAVRILDDGGARIVIVTGDSPSKRQRWSPSCW